MTSRRSRLCAVAVLPQHNDGRDGHHARTTARIQRHCCSRHGRCRNRGYRCRILLDRDVVADLRRGSRILELDLILGERGLVIAIQNGDHFWHRVMLVVSALQRWGIVVDDDGGVADGARSVVVVEVVTVLLLLIDWTLSC